MGLGDLIESVVEKFTGHNDENEESAPQAQGSTADQQSGILPASQDPLGDPADQQQSSSDQQAGILPASQDPLGDPADQR